jgi:RimJ/RimL family protein N-acetyltransferase
MPLPIETTRLRLRRLTYADVEKLAAYRSDERVARLQSWSSMSLAEAEALVNNPGELGDDGRWAQVAIALKNTDTLIGDVGSCVSGDAAEIGFSLAPEAQNRGYAAEACRALIELLFARGVRRIVAIVDARNVAAIALIERLGMTLERTEEAEFKGAMCLEHHFALARVED